MVHWIVYFHATAGAESLHRVAAFSEGVLEWVGVICDCDVGSTEREMRERER